MEAPEKGGYLSMCLQGDIRFFRVYRYVMTVPVLICAGDLWMDHGSGAIGWELYYDRL